MSTWVKKTDREPTKEDFPLIAGRYHENGEWLEYTHFRFGDAGYQAITHWRSIKCEPPARELTQREKDIEMAMKVGGYQHMSRVESMLEAIYAERREVNALLESWFFNPKWGKCDELQAIRARLDELGGRK